MNHKKTEWYAKLGPVEKIYLGILLVIFALIVVHAPLSVGFGVLFPKYVLIIKAWKEILLIIALPVAFYLMYKKQCFYILKRPVILAAIIYTGLNLLFLLYKPQGLQPSLAGLEINLRYVIYFCLVYLTVELFPQCKRLFIKVGVAGALVVLGFATLQVFILPHDILKYIGYSRDTIAPYLTIDKNTAFIRINSTLRGPNPLGAYSVIALSAILAAWLKGKVARRRKPLLIGGILAISDVVALWASYSRSALIAAVVSIAIVLVVGLWKKMSLKKWLIAGGVILLAVVGGLAIGGKSVVSNVLLHENPSDKSGLVNSNEGHAQSLVSAWGEFVHQPLGDGIGSTGSASLLGDNPYIIENQYLLVAHEVGWIGLALFLFMFIYILAVLWQNRRDWLALSVFASGVGLAMIGLMLPVWTDDTVSIIWWGLAALAIAGNEKGIMKLWINKDDRPKNNVNC